MTRHKILVTGPSWIGDMVMAQSLFKFLHDKTPDLIIDVLAPAWTLPLLDRMPEVRKGIPFHSRHGNLDLMMRIKTGLRLKSEQYDEAIIIPRSFKSVIPAWFAGIKKRTGFNTRLGLINNARTFIATRNELFIRRYISLVADDAYTIRADALPEPRLRVDNSRSELLLAKYDLDRNGFVAFAPGAEFGPSKQWPSAHFAALADGLMDKNLQCIIIGSEKDARVGKEIMQASKAKDIINLCGKTTLPDVIDIISAARCSVTNDSGLMHLAYASGTKLIAIYGSTSAEYTPPLSSNSIIFQKKISCRPCFERTCRYGHYNCLTRVTPEEVLSAQYLQ